MMPSEPAKKELSVGRLLLISSSGTPAARSTVCRSFVSRNPRFSTSQDSKAARNASAETKPAVKRELLWGRYAAPYDDEDEDDNVGE